MAGSRQPTATQPSNVRHPTPFLSGSQESKCRIHIKRVRWMLAASLLCSACIHPHTQDTLLARLQLTILNPTYISQFLHLCPSASLFGSPATLLTLRAKREAGQNTDRETHLRRSCLHSKRRRNTHPSIGTQRASDKVGRGARRWPWRKGKADAHHQPEPQRVIACTHTHAHTHREPAWNLDKIDR